MYEKQRQEGEKIKSTTNLNEISFIKLAYRLINLNIIRYFDLWIALHSPFILIFTVRLA